MGNRLISRTFRITEMDDAMLLALAEDSGTLNKSTELRTLIRREIERRGLSVDPDEQENEGDDCA